MVPLFLFIGLCVSGQPEVVETVDIAPVWAGHPVGFSLLTHEDRQFVAFYNADREMVVAQRTLGGSEWTFQPLPEKVEWDSHNSITMTLDSGKFIHLSGNMHVDDLVYFRGTKPLDITTLQRVQSMVGKKEDRVTYPKFITRPDGSLIFTYRDGSSGSGDQIYNVYDVESRAWRRLLETPFTDGEGQRNAYFDGPMLGPDGTFHMCWVWRESPDCATNNNLSYARSKDLVSWESSGGTPLVLPIALAEGEIVDPVPVGGGLLNGNAHVGFDIRNRVIVTYHKYDEAGNLQLYAARKDDERWTTRPITTWDYRWEFSGGGSIDTEVHVQRATFEPGTGLLVGFSHRKFGSGRILLDEESLEPIRVLEPVRSIPGEVTKVESTFPGMRVRTATDLGSSETPGERYVLRWETLGPNRDRPRDPPWPEPSMLRVVRIRDGEGQP